MKSSNRSIFREEAVRRYIQGKEKAILPRLVSPRTFSYLWFLLGFLTVSSAIAWFTRIPVYTSGSAAVVRLNDGKIVVIALFEPQHLSSLQTTKKLFLSFDAMGDRASVCDSTYRVSHTIIAVEPKIISPDVIQKRFALNAQVATSPSVVAIAQLKPISNNLPPSAYLGSIGRAEAEVGSQRLVSLLPFIGQNFAP